MIFAVFYRGKLIARFETRFEAAWFILNCRIVMSYDGIDCAPFEIKEEFV